MSKVSQKDNTGQPQRGPHSWGWALAALAVAIASIALYAPNLQAWRSTRIQKYNPSVTIAQGTIVGRSVDDGTYPEPLEGFMGIPYALPPTGNRRFREAEPVKDGNGTYYAYYLGPR